jgi:cytochrome c
MIRRVLLSSFVVSALVCQAGAVDAPPPPVAAPTDVPPTALTEPGTEEAMVSAAEPLTGKIFLEQTCSGCHAVGATGDSPLAKAPTFRDIVQRYPPEDLEESLAEGIVTGHPDMPQVELDPKTIADVIAYLDALKVVTGP